MRIALYKNVISCLLFSVSSLALSETQFEIQTSKLFGQPLFDQLVTESDVITVSPKVSDDATGDISILNQCLWSVYVSMNDQTVELTAGKMICIGPNGEVFESRPQGELTNHGLCQTPQCNEYEVKENNAFTMVLDSNLIFTLQPRNERK